MLAIRPLRLAVTLTAIAFAAAAAPRTAGAQDIEACYANKSGSMYRVGAAGAPADCTNGGTKMTWPSKLPSGTVFGMQLVPKSFSVAANSEGSAPVACATGSVVMSGGYILNFQASALRTDWQKVTVRRAAPVGVASGLPTQYQVLLANNSPYPVSVGMQVICAKIAP